MNHTHCISIVNHRRAYNGLAMPLVRLVIILLAALALSAQATLPELKVDATDGGSALVVRNTSTQPLTAYFIELVGYPGSTFSFYKECLSTKPLPAGATERIPITNMTVGAAPEYVQMQAAIFADGSIAGAPEKVTQLLGLRRTTLETTRDLIARIEKGKASGASALAAEFNQVAAAIPEPGKRQRSLPAFVAGAAKRDFIHSTAAALTRSGIDSTLQSLTASESALAAAKPAL